MGETNEESVSHFKPFEEMRKIIQDSLKENPLTPESIAEMFDPIKDKKYYDLFMRIYKNNLK